VKPAPTPDAQYTTHLSLSPVPTLARFTRIHKYNNVQCILLLFNVGNVLLCVIYQLNFIIGMYVNEKRFIYRVRYYPRFRASAVGLGTYHPRIRGGDYCTRLLLRHVSTIENSHPQGISFLCEMILPEYGYSQ
jgi:hypothetical protein